MNEIKNDLRADGADTCADQDGSVTYDPTMVGWIARIISLGLLLTLVGSIGWQASQPTRPVTFSAEMQSKEIREDSGSFLIPVEISNQGSETALFVKIEIVTGSSRTALEIPMIGQKESVTFVVSAPTRPTSLTHRIVSYEAP